MTPQEIQASLEAIIYAADEPATLEQIAHALGVEKTEARAALDLLAASYQTDERGIEVRKVAGGWKFYTKPHHHDVVRKFIKSLQPPLRLTMPALETLAVIAYKQPVTLPEINEIRGVNCGGVIKTLLEKRLISTAGRKPVIGRPILYRTSKQFLMCFGLSELDELPSLKEFEALAQAALGDDAGIAPTEPENGPQSEPPAEQESGTKSAESAPSNTAAEPAVSNDPSAPDVSAAQPTVEERSQAEAAVPHTSPAVEGTPQAADDSADKSRAASS
jgi:segregation and condensation protein B